MLTRSKAKKQTTSDGGQPDDYEKYILRVKIRPEDETKETTNSTKSDSGSTVQPGVSVTGPTKEAVNDIFSTFILRVPARHEPVALDYSFEMNDYNDEYQTICTYRLKEPYGREDELKITYFDYNSLKGTNYVDSGIVFFFLKMLQERFSMEGRDFNIIDSYFYTKLTADGENGEPDLPLYTYKSIKKWAGVNLYDNQFCLYPIFKDKHWSLIVVWGLEHIANIFTNLTGADYPSVIYLDSLYTDDYIPGELFKKYIIYDYAMKNNLFQDEDDLVDFITNNHRKIKTYIPDVPKQDNFHDCGIYLLTYAELILDNPDVVINKLIENRLNDWFGTEIIDNKRKIIRKLIRDIRTNGQGTAVQTYRNIRAKELNKYLI
jgi:Ulp1 family protease